MSNQDYLDEIKDIRELFSDLVHYTPLELNYFIYFVFFNLLL